MPRMTSTTVANPADLTPYKVVKESWITDGRGHSALRTPAAEGEEPVVVDMHPLQAEYMVHSGQIVPIPGRTKGYPADASTGEAMDLTSEERRRVQEQPNVGEASGDPVLGQGFAGSSDAPVVLGNASAEEAAQQDTAQASLSGETTAVEAPESKTRRGR